MIHFLIFLTYPVQALGYAAGAWAFWALVTRG